MRPCEVEQQTEVHHAGLNARAGRCGRASPLVWPAPVCGVVGARSWTDCAPALAEGGGGQAALRLPSTSTLQQQYRRHVPVTFCTGRDVVAVFLNRVDLLSSLRMVDVPDWDKRVRCVRVRVHVSEYDFVCIFVFSYSIL